jgi:hypothetical protein
MEPEEPSGAIAAPPAPKRRRPALAILAALIIAGGVAGIAYAATSGSDTAKPAPAASAVEPATHEIVYQLGGTAETADITISTDGGGTSQQQGVDVPLTNKSGTPGIQFQADPGDFLYISAQNNDDGTISCEISEDGLVIAQEESSGEYAIVTCQGRA